MYHRLGRLVALGKEGSGCLLFGYLFIFLFFKPRILIFLVDG